MNLELPNVGYYLSTLPDDVFSKVREETKEMMLKIDSATPYNHALIGHIKHEYVIDDNFTFLKTFILSQLNEHLKGIKHADQHCETKVDGAWINFQSAGEFNPMHRHSGDYSFVIWVQIPYKVADELAMFRTNNPCTSCFEFYYINTLGEIATEKLKLSTEDEGKFAIFPSKMRHGVQPFYTSQEYRISISGNISFIKGVIDESTRSVLRLG